MSFSAKKNKKIKKIVERKKTKTQGGFGMVIYSCHLQRSVLLMFEKSKFRLRLLGFGRILQFTNAKTHRAGGFSNKEKASVLSSAK